jgi:hypothetical protein
VRHLGRCAFLSNLVSLELSHCRLGPDAFTGLSDCFFMTRLKHLGIDNNPLFGITGFENCRFLEILRGFSLDHCQVGDQALEILAMKDYLSEAKELRLRECCLTSAGLAHLTKCTYFRWLVVLDLSFNEIT